MPELEELPLNRFCSFVMYMLTRNGSETDNAKLRAKLWRPPPGVAADPRSPWSPENEKNALAAFKSQAAR